MSNKDIQTISELLLGITNLNKNVRSLSISKIQELYLHNFDLLLFCILEIIEKSTNNNHDLLKITSLIICRKIIENADLNIWKNVKEELKDIIKTKLLCLLNNEIYLNDNFKVCDLIIELLEKIFEDGGIWPEIINLILNIYNYDPNQGDTNSLQIISLLYIIKGGINILFKRLSINLNKFIDYLEKIFNSSNIDVKAKILAGELVYEIISFAGSSEIEKIKKIIKNILIALCDSYQLFEKNKQNEKNIKAFLKICIDIENIEPDLFDIYFQDIFNLDNVIISNKNFKDQKIREMGFELIMSLIEDKPSFIYYSENKDQILFKLFELILNYALEFDKNIEINLDDSIYLDNNNSYNIDDYLEEEILFSLSILERLFEAIKNETINNIFKLIIQNYIQKSWKYQYVILLSINIYSSYNEDMNFIQQFLKPIFNFTFSNENKVRLSSIYCIKNFIRIYNPDFMRQYAIQILPIINQLLKNENNLKCKLVIINCLKIIIHYNVGNELNNYIENIFGLLMNMFGKENNNIILRKLIIIDIIELNKKRNEEKINVLLNKIDINTLMNYFIDVFNKKIDQQLYGVLLELIVSIGLYSPEKNKVIFQNILNYIIKLIKDFNYNEEKKEESISINNISKYLTKILPIIIKINENQNLLIELINNIISLIKYKNIMSTNILSDNDFEINNLLLELNDSNITYQNIYNCQTEEFSCLLSILLCILNSIRNNNITNQIILDIENEIMPLINYPYNQLIRNQSAKIISKLIFFIKDKEKKINKSIFYIHILINSIEKEAVALTTKKFFERIKEILESNNLDFLSKEEINKIYNKFTIFTYNIKFKKIQLINKQKNLKEKYISKKKFIKEEDSDYEYLNELIIKQIKILEEIQIEIVDIIGLLLKLHKDKCNNIIGHIINNIIPSYLDSNNINEIKMSLYLLDDLIEYIGQEILGEKIWENIYSILIKLVISEDYPTRQAAAYGIGIFSMNTKTNFIKYGQGLIENLYESLSLSTNLIKNNNIIENKEEFYLAFDNIISALGKIIKFHFNDKIVQDNIFELIEKWIMNLPIKYDESEQEQQHEWMINIFIFKRELIPIHCCYHYFESLSQIYQTKYSNQKLDNQIEMIFINYVNKEENMRKLLASIYENSSADIKNKLNILAKKIN